MDRPSTQAELDDFRKITVSFYKQSIELAIAVAMASIVHSELSLAHSILSDFLSKNMSIYADRIRFHMISGFLLMRKPKDLAELKAELVASALHFAERAETNLKHMENLGEELHHLIILAQGDTSHATRQ